MAMSPKDLQSIRERVASRNGGGAEVDRAALLDEVDRLTRELASAQKGADEGDAMQNIARLADQLPRSTPRRRVFLCLDEDPATPGTGIEVDSDACVRFLRDRGARRKLSVCLHDGRAIEWAELPVGDRLVVCARFARPATEEELSAEWDRNDSSPPPLSQDQTN